MTGGIKRGYGILGDSQRGGPDGRRRSKILASTLVVPTVDRLVRGAKVGPSVFTAQ